MQKALKHRKDIKDTRTIDSNLSVVLFFVLVCFTSTLLLASCSKQSETESGLSLSFTEIIDPEDESANKDIKVSLLKKKVIVKEGDIEKIYDFDKKSLLTIDHQKKTYLRNSLYGILAGRKAKRDELKELDISQYDLEAKLSIINKTSPLKGAISESVTEDGSTRYIYKNREVVKINYSQNSLNKDLVKSFSRYLLYEHSIHPYIRNTISSNSKIPSSLSYLTLNLQNAIEAKKFRLNSIGEVEKLDLSIPEAYKKVFSRNLNLDQIIFFSRNTNRMFTDDEFKEIVEDLKNHRRYADAYLAAYLYALQSGDFKEAGKHIKEITQKAPKNSPMYTITKAFANENAQQSITELQAFSRDNLEFDYVIDILLAKKYISKEEYQTAEELLLRALILNPFVSGSYKDLGDTFYGLKNMEDAWTCWDKARQLVTNVLEIDTVVHLEEMLEVEHPEFF